MICIYGALARVFEKKYKTPAKNIPIQVNSAPEMFQALEANFPGFKAMLKRKGFYRISKGGAFTRDKDLDSNEIDMNFSDKDWHLMPVAAGCKNGGLMKIILGAALIGASFAVPGLGMTLLGTDIMFSSVLVSARLSMGLGGVAQMLTPSPGAGNYADRERPEERPSYLSNNPVNGVEPGHTRPVAYGDVWSGSITVSGGMKVEEI